VDYVSNGDLAAYYSSAVALVMPSLYEGFGLPMIEAMACGCPVIASNSSSLPEVAGDAALFFAPLDSQKLAHLVNLLITEPTLKNKLSRRGFERVTHFSLESMVRATLHVYQQIEEEIRSRHRRGVDSPVPIETAQSAAPPSEILGIKKGSPLLK
jgi:alpha-1,3-rhamnosyl/mannosyltransferase